MKKRSFISFVLIFLIIFYSAPTYYATNNENGNTILIKNELKEIMDSANKKDLIPVYIWYEDINHTLASKEAENDLGYSIENCSKVNFIKSDLSVSQNDQATQINEFIESTKKQRKAEKQQVNEYIHKKREVSRGLYKIKSNEILKKINVKSKNIDFISEYAPMLILKLNKNQIDKISKIDGIVEIGYYSEPIFASPSVESCKISTGQSKLCNNLDLTGDGIKVGMIESGFPEADNELDTNNIVNIGNISTSGHATNTAKIIMGNTNGFAKDVSLYSTDAQFSNIEQLLTNQVQIINV